MRASISPDEAGLSPRVRGNLLFAVWMYLLLGTIPACAGEPPKWAASPSPFRDYPRVCGGTPREGEGRPAPVGLSPRVRGNLVLPHPQVPRRGTIPACAGEPRPCPRISRVSGDYPRVCGGTMRSVSLATSGSGLSPRVRGNRSPRCRQLSAQGTIPACAGEPPRERRPQLVEQDYPRVCGGTNARRCGDASARGLSPRVRGNRIPPALAAVSHGTIPACAGEPSSTPCSGTGIADYPRVCGGTSNLFRFLKR